MKLLYMAASLAAVAVGGIFLADSGRSHPGPRTWVYWPSVPRYGMRALIPGTVIAAGGLAALILSILH
jgi:hypothetical protein